MTVSVGVWVAVWVGVCVPVNVGEGVTVSVGIVVYVAVGDGRTMGVLLGSRAIVVGFGVSVGATVGVTIGTAPPQAAKLSATIVHKITRHRVILVAFSAVVDYLRAF